MGWSHQIQINQTYFPRTTINNPIELIVEYEKGVESIGVQGAASICKGSFMRCLTDQDYLEICPFKDDFWSCFLEIAALDDQTITGNSFYTPVELNTDSVIRGLRYPSYATTPILLPKTNGVSYSGVLNIFKPLDGKFQLVYNFDKVIRGSSIATSGTPVQGSQVIFNASLLKFAVHKVREGTTMPGVVCTAVQLMDALIIFEGLGNLVTQF